MLIFKVQGGLGNQMFIYAMARNFQLLYNRNVKLDIISATNYPQLFKLDVFNTQLEYASLNEIEATRDGRNLDHAELLLFKIRRRFFPYFKKPYVVEQSLNFSAEYKKLMDPVYISGLWQTEKYFSSISDSLRKDFTFKASPDHENSLILNHIQSCNSVSLHCRRGDFIHNPKDSLIQISHDYSYYTRALDLLKSKVSDIQLFIFSDDPEYTKSQLIFDFPTTYVENNLHNKQDYEDLRLMTACRHHILSTSTFAWWGAWLNPDPDKIVIAPGERLKPSPDPYFKYDHYYPENWLLL